MIEREELKDGYEKYKKIGLTLFLPGEGWSYKDVIKKNKYIYKEDINKEYSRILNHHYLDEYLYLTENKDKQTIADVFENFLIEKYNILESIEEIAIQLKMKKNTEPEIDIIYRFKGEKKENRYHFFFKSSIE